MPTNESRPNRNPQSALKRVLAGSRAVAALQRVSSTTARWLNAVTERLTSVVQQSFLYRWLTAEPDPEVIVINLRETHTVGPFITLLDRITETLAPCYQQSRLKRGIDTIAALAVRAADTRLGRLLVALFEPPEPPEQNDAERTDRDPEQSRQE